MLVIIIKYNGEFLLLLLFIRVVMLSIVFPFYVSAHARYMYNHQCAAKRQSIYGINTTGCSLGCI